MADTTAIPPELARMLDHDAGKAHSAAGPVLASLARHEQIVRAAVAAELRSVMFPCPTHVGRLAFDSRCIGCQRHAALVGAARIVAGRESPNARAVREMRQTQTARHGDAEPVRGTTATRMVLRVLLDADGEDLWGFRICRLAGLGSGTVYPILARLKDRGWAAARWEPAGGFACATGPRRRFWELTDAGRAAAVATWPRDS